MHGIVEDNYFIDSLLSDTLEYLIEKIEKNGKILGEKL